jgi:hypothetical protein
VVGAADPKEFFHFLVEKSAAWAVRLYPFAIDDELRNGPLAYVSDNFLRSAGAGLDINLGVSNRVLLEEAFGLAAIAAPRSGIHQDLHTSIITTTTAFSLPLPWKHHQERSVELQTLGSL